MWRRAFAWVVAVALAVVGTQAAHWAAYTVVAGSAERRAHLLADSGHGYMTHVPLALGVLTALALLALVSEARLTRDGAPARPPAFWTFAVLAPAVFGFQEHFERLAHDGAFPWGAALEPTFVVGMALQLPFALLAYLVARLLLRIAAGLGRGLPALPRPLPPETGGSWVVVCASIFHPVLCPLGFGLRGPPLAS